MRLDPQLERTGNGQWVARGAAWTDERRVRQAAQAYFKELGRPGAPLSSAVNTIAAQTGLDGHRVQELLQELYIVRNTNIFNQRR